MSNANECKTSKMNNKRKYDSKTKVHNENKFNICERTKIYINMSWRYIFNLYLFKRTFFSFFFIKWIIKMRRFEIGRRKLQSGIKYVY